VSTDFDSRPDSQQLADLKNQTEELERKLSDARMSLERELAQSAWGNQPAPGYPGQNGLWAPGEMTDEPDGSGLWVPYNEAEPYAEPAPYAGQGSYAEAEPHAGPAPYAGQGSYAEAEPHAGPAPYGEPAPYAAPAPYAERHPPADYGDDRQYGWDTAEDRTGVLITGGRRSVRGRRLPRGYTVGIAAAVGIVLVTVAIGMLFRGSPSWPASVATVQAEAARACNNPDVQSEPGQVNFACAQGTRQILWVFALLTSGNNPNFADATTGRRGLEPIAPAQGGEVAWSLNLHHPYDPANPIDSLQVAARAINNIIGGATVTGADGNPVVQPGLESSPANCVRYTGSAAVTRRQNFPALCARAVASAAGRAALVADVYQKWVVGAAPSDAQDAAVLFENADNPGDPQVQAILKHVPGARPSG
jgi:hypothetical protein